MRPLVLKFRGLRSYHSDTEIDFRDRRLVAVIGDTGAGKSSILEALCFALYGTSTWSGKASGELIATGAASLSVELSFIADGRTWRVNRTIRATTSAPLHKLVAEDDESVRFDGATAVNAQVRKLVGMDHEGFLRAVVLPQGRFQQLLQSTASQRNSVLKGLFRVDELQSARAVAEVHRDRVRELLEEARVARARLLVDPRAVADSASREMEELQTRIGYLETVSVEVRQCSEVAAEQRKAADQINLRAVAADKARRPDEFESLTRLVELDGRLRREMQDARRLADDLESQAESTASELRIADAAGLGPAGLSEATALLREGLKTISDVQSVSDRLSEESQGLATLEQEIANLANESARLLEDEGKAVMVADRTQSLAQEAKGRLEDARSALSAARDWRERHMDAVRARERAAKDLDEKSDLVAIARDNYEELRSELATAAAELERLQRANHAAAAAEGLSPGDVCPVCGKPLAEGFVPTLPSGLESARAKHRLAADGERQALEHLSRKESDVASAEASLTTAESHEHEADASLQRALAKVVAFVTEVDLDSGDEVALGSLFAAFRAIDEEYERARAMANLATVEVKTHRAKADEIGHRFDDLTSQLERQRQDLAARRDRHEATVRSLVPSLRPSSEWDVESVSGALNQANEMLLSVQAKSKERDDLLRGAQIEGKRQQALAASIEADVNLPLRAVDTNQARLEECLLALSLVLGAVPPVRPEPDTLADRAEAARVRERWAESLKETCEQKLAAIQRQAEEADRNATQGLARVGCVTLQELVELTARFKAERAQAKERLEAAEQQVPMVEDLEGRLAAGRGLEEALATIYTHLSDAKFIDYVISRRQQVLLAIASEVFGSMTNDRYGFSEDFRVVDGWSGQARDVMTLSGGETFLASLSLALALVELAGRSGGRVEALFLDEGFASLDANVLPEALKALEAQASGGRLVVVISHLRAVAETLEEVLYVQRGPDGSRVDWLTPSSRDALLESDAESGLLA